ncbi:hypothetical protein BDE02_03G083100 [Populus trichocarpa]|nr:hypothetical protein BDE02_03G083100 [Populus trichocarpa]KAI5594594.1 hypothetical protein BDE02_03G083100 [Populus trichocarpa]
MYLEDEDITKEAYLASGFYSLIFLLYAGCFFSDKSFKFCCSTICVPNLFFFTLVEELKRHLDDRIQMQIGVFTQTYNDDNEDLCIERKKMRNQEELFCGQMRTRVAGFVRIEEFVAKFMSFYKYNGIKQG